MSKISKIAVIACGVVEPEVRHLLREVEHVRALSFLPMGLHDEPERLQTLLQERVAQAEADPEVDAIVLAYGLCSRGVENLRRERCPLVMARAHDCVTLFLGDKDRYEAHQRENPGTYWFNPGWIRGGRTVGPEREARLRAEYTGKFEPEDIDYLLEMDRESFGHYQQAVYVGLGLGDPAADEAHTRQCAACMDWGFDRIPGDPALLRALLHGDWDEHRFLIVPPRHVVRLTGDERIIRAEPEPPASCPD